MTAIHDADVRILPYFGYRSERSLRLRARALRGNDADFSVTSRWDALQTMIGQFASREVAGLDAELSFDAGGERAIVRSASSDAEGFLDFDITFEDDTPMPPQTTWQRAALSWSTVEGNQTVDAHILAPGSSADLGIISDIDDTIIETGITGDFKAIARNWKRVFLQMPGQRVMVPGAREFYEALGASNGTGDTQPIDSVGAPPDPNRPCFYVSSSPWNLFCYLVAFKREQGLPLGPAFLRDWGLNRQTFGSSSHGDHKTDAILGILEHYPALRFVLIGDDTQKDLGAFGAIAKQHPDRIAGVFIRLAAGEDLSPQEQAARSAIVEAGIPLWMGEDYSTGQEFLAKADLADDPQAANLVAAVEKPRH